MESYSDSEEEIPKDLPAAKRPRVSIAVYVDNSFAHELVSRNFITGTIVMLKNTILRRVSKRRNSVENSPAVQT
jgi:hypothetical protein